MLLYRRMQRLGLALAVLLASTTAASAGTYIGLGIGSEASGSAEFPDGRDGGSMDGYGRSTRLLVGTRLGRLSIEGQGGRFMTSFDLHDYQATQLGVGVKGSLPLGNNFELYGKLGVERTWLSTDFATMHDAAGSGWFLGVGFEYRLDLGVTAASIFVDYQRAKTGFTNDYLLEWDGVTSLWTLGATVSL